MPKSALGRAIEAMTDVFSVFCGWWLIALSVFTCVEMVARKFFRFSLQGVDEIGGYTLAVASALAFSGTLIHRGHTRIDFMVSRLPAGARAALNTLAMVSLAGMALFAVYRGWNVLSETLEFQSRATTPLQTPLWIPQSLWYLGWIVFAIVTVILAVHACLLLVRDPDAVNRAYGPPTLEEEIESETGGLHIDIRSETKS
jgi:TRAP-type C4-dicarboxylate transport system permease small subunit